MDGTKRLMRRLLIRVFETYATKNCGFCREWFCAQAYVEVGVGALHRGIGKTKRNANQEIVIVGRTVVLWIGEK